MGKELNFKNSNSWGNHATHPMGENIDRCIKSNKNDKNWLQYAFSLIPNPTTDLGIK